MSSVEQSRAEQITDAVKEQVTELMDVQAPTILKALDAQKGLSISLTVKLKGNDDVCEVATDISYTLSKVKDSVDAVIRFNQEEMFD